VADGKVEKMTTSRKATGVSWNSSKQGKTILLSVAFDCDGRSDPQVPDIPVVIL
jgi:hypothetical protein